MRLGDQTDQTDSLTDTGRISEAKKRIRQVLAPLDKTSFPSEYMYHLNSAAEFNRKAQTIELLYADLYAQANAVEKEIEAIQNSFS